MLLNPYRFGVPSPLLTGLISYWKLDEASGNAIDSHATNDLTDTNTVGTAAGKVGSARSFVAASSEYFVKTTSGASLSTGDIDFTFSCWVNATTLPGSVIISKWQDTGSQLEFMLYYSSFMRWIINNGGSIEINLGTIATGTWNHIVCWYDSVNNQTGARINRGAAILGAAATGPISRPAIPFWLGQRGNATQYWNGLIDEVGFWKRMLTPQECTNLYNDGTGYPYPFDPLPPLNLLAGLVSFWKMDEASGDALDIHGTNQLTDTNTVTSAAGKLGTARNFNGTNEYFTRATSGADLSTGDIDFTFAVWCRPTALAAMRPLISKWLDTGSQFEFKLFYDSVPGLFTLDVRNTADTATGRAAASNFGIPPLNNWYLVICWHDSVNNQLGICVNNNTPNVTAWTTGVIARPGMPFWIGSRTGAAEWWGGQIDEVGFWKKVLLPAERTALYSFGSGLPYSSFT